MSLVDLYVSDVGDVVVDNVVPAEWQYMCCHRAVAGGDLGKTLVATMGLGGSSAVGESRCGGDRLALAYMFWTWTGVML